MKVDTLDALNDSDLQIVIARSQELLKQRDDDRKAKALADARTPLASVGLSLKDLNGKGRQKKGPVYHAGQAYHHPENKMLVWNGKGKKPTWLATLESEGRKAVESGGVALRSGVRGAVQNPVQ